ncbi:5'-adenylylsulfate reductase-like 5 isoform X2 [Rhododendron vialii]|uniref:5'-adenylylsulfate reductase-like 5 isoform X2 n=1 Tax=Rhododendron vialii TaxID=182163 RepID=UPI0026602507|nr:5'-adenylylsulfate reductase-like 5 isoform X2 [Rhododendron vialii]
MMDGKSLDGGLSSTQTNVYIAVLFYGSSCPFSNAIRTKFAALSTMFPQIKHVMVEQSSAMPSVLSRYGIHSVPSILVVNRMVKTQYYGSKNLSSFVQFYKGTTGLDPILDLTEDQGSYSESGLKFLYPWKGNSAKEILMMEPYLVFSALFLFLRVYLYLFPRMISNLIALWFAFVPHLNMGFLGELSHLLGRVLHVIDFQKVWSKLRRCKTRNLHNGARSARVWASSLASVSLGETSSGRLVPPGDS